MSKLTRISQTISREDGQDVTSDSLLNAREHCQIDKARAFEREDDVTDCPDSPRECEKCGLTRISHTVSSGWNLFFAALGICSGCVVIALVFTMVNTALPSIQHTLDLSMSSLQWMMTVFGLINCAMLVTSGRLADIFGRKKLFMFGLFCTGIAMAGGGFCQSAGGLIVCMAFAGLGNAILLPVSQAMLAIEFPKEKKGQAIGLWASAIASAMAAGPVLGGVVTSALGWRWVFWLNAPVVALSILLIAIFAKESRNEEDPAEVDVWGMIFLALTIVSFVLISTEYHHIPTAVILGLALLGLWSLYRLAKHERVFSAPIITDQLWKNRVFLCSSLASFCLVFFIWSIFFILPLYLQNELHLSAMTSGLMMLGITLPVAFIAPVVGKYYRVGRAWLMTLLGFLGIILSTYLQMGFNIGTPLWLISISSAVFGLAYSFIWGPTATAALSCFPPHQSGIASGTFVTVQELGGTLGLAIIVSYVAHFSELSEGFKGGMTLLLAVGILGCILSLFMKCDEPQEEPQTALH